LLSLPFVLAGCALGALLSLPFVRLLLALLLGAAALLAVEAVALVRLLGTRHHTLLEVAIGAAYAASLCLLIWLWWRLRRRRRLRVQRFESLLALSPAQFEAAVGELLRGAGYRDVKHVGRAGDLGADLRCRDRQGRSVVVQCKRHAPGIRVGSAEVQAFIGMVTVHHQAERGIFVTTSAFTAPARRLAETHAVTLIDGPALARMVKGT
jgi:restriction system protein